MGNSEQNFYRWKKKLKGIVVAEVRWLRVLEKDNRKLYQLVADLSLDKQILRDALRRKSCSQLNREPDRTSCRLPTTGNLPRRPRVHTS